MPIGRDRRRNRVRCLRSARRSRSRSSARNLQSRPPVAKKALSLKTQSWYPSISPADFSTVSNPRLVTVGNFSRLFSLLAFSSFRTRYSILCSSSSMLCSRSNPSRCINYCCSTKTSSTADNLSLCTRRAPSTFPFHVSRVANRCSMLFTAYRRAVTFWESERIGLPT